MDESKTDVKNYSDVDSEYWLEEDRNCIDSLTIHLLVDNFAQKTGFRIKTKVGKSQEKICYRKKKKGKGRKK